MALVQCSASNDFRQPFPEFSILIHPPNAPADDDYEGEDDTDDPVDPDIRHDNLRLG